MASASFFSYLAYILESCWHMSLSVSRWLSSYTSEARAERTFSSFPRVVSRSIITIKAFWLALLSSRMLYASGTARSLTRARSFAKKSRPSSSSFASSLFTLRYSSLGFTSDTDLEGTPLALLLLEPP